MSSPTAEQFKALNTAFQYLNSALFEGKLSPCMVTFSRNTNVIGGYHAENMWEQTLPDGTVKRIPEIAINVNIMKKTDLLEFYLVLTHELVHQWQRDFGEPGENGFHNVEWAEKAMSVGLVPDNNNGGHTGVMIKTTLIEGSRLEKALRAMPEEAVIPWEASELHLPDAQEETVVVIPGGGTGSPDTKPTMLGDITKYTCPQCGLNAWAKRKQAILCGRDSRYLIEQVS